MQYPADSTGDNTGVMPQGPAAVRTPRTAPGMTRRAMLMLGSASALLAACRRTPARQPMQEEGPPPGIQKGAVIQWAVDSGPTRTKLRQDQVALFKQKFPDIEVQFIEGATDTEKLLAMFAGGTPPDLFRQETFGFATFVSRGAITALDPYIRRDRFDTEDFFPAALRNWQWKGRQYGIPFLGIRIMYYNRAMVDQAGAARPPASWKDGRWTWDAFLELARKVVVRQGTSATRWAFDVGTVRRDWQTWVWSNGGELFSDDGTKTFLGEEPAIQALQFLADLIHRHRVAPTAAERRDQGGRRGLFLGGNLLMYHEPVNSVAANRREVTFDWSLTATPHGRGKATSSGGGVGWFLSEPSRVKNETWELMKVLASKESVKMEAVRGEAPPGRISVARDPEFVNPPEPPGADMKVVVEALEVMHIEPPLINGVEIDRILADALAPVWAGEQGAREAIQAVLPRITPLLNPAG